MCISTNTVIRKIKYYFPVSKVVPPCREGIEVNIRVTPLIHNPGTRYFPHCISSIFFFPSTSPDAFSSLQMIMALYYRVFCFIITSKITHVHLYISYNLRHAFQIEIKLLINVSENYITIYKKGSRFNNLTDA